MSEKIVVSLKIVDGKVQVHMESDSVSFIANFLPEQARNMAKQMAKLAEFASIDGLDEDKKNVIRGTFSRKTI